MPSIPPRGRGAREICALAVGLLVAAPVLAGAPAQRRASPPTAVAATPPAVPRATFSGAWTIDSGPRLVRTREIQRPVATEPTPVALGSGGAVALLEVSAPSGISGRRPGGFTAMLEVDELPERASVRKRLASVSVDAVVDPVR